MVQGWGPPKGLGPLVYSVNQGSSALWENLCQILLGATECTENMGDRAARNRNHACMWFFLKLPHNSNASLNLTSCPKQLPEPLLPGLCNDPVRQGYSAYWQSRKPRYSEEPGYADVEFRFICESCHFPFDYLEFTFVPIWIKSRGISSFHPILHRQVA